MTNQPDARGLEEILGSYWSDNRHRESVIADLIAWCHRQCDRQIKACAASVLEATEDIRAEAAVQATPIVEIDR